MTGSDIVFVFLMDTIQYKLKKLYNTNKKIIQCTLKLFTTNIKL